MGTVEQEENRAGRAAVYCVGETGSKVMDRAVLQRDHLPNNAEWFCIRGRSVFGKSSIETIQRNLKDKVYLLLLFDLRDGLLFDLCDEYEDMLRAVRAHATYYLTDQLANFLVLTAREQGLKIFTAVVVGGIVRRSYRKDLYKALLSIREASDCIIPLSDTAGQRPEEVLWQASQLLLSMTVPQYISLYPEDVREIFPHGKRACLGTGHTDGARLTDAVDDLLSSREFTEQLKQAGGLLIHISCPQAGADLQSIKQAAQSLLAAAPPKAAILLSVKLEEAPQAGAQIIALAVDRQNRGLKPYPMKKHEKG